jgi:hypothetical protein
MMTFWKPSRDLYVPVLWRIGSPTKSADVGLHDASRKEGLRSYSRARRRLDSAPETLPKDFGFGVWKTSHRPQFTTTVRTAVDITSETTSQVLLTCASDMVGCTRNIRLVSPSSRAVLRRSVGRHSGGKAFSK